MDVDDVRSREVFIKGLLDVRIQNGRRNCPRCGGLQARHESLARVEATETRPERFTDVVARAPSHDGAAHELWCLRCIMALDGFERVFAVAKRLQGEKRRWPPSVTDGCDKSAERGARTLANNGWHTLNVGARLRRACPELPVNRLTRVEPPLRAGAGRSKV